MSLNKGAKRNHQTLQMQSQWSQLITLTSRYLYIKYQYSRNKLVKIDISFWRSITRNSERTAKNNHFSISFENRLKNHREKLSLQLINGLSYIAKTPKNYRKLGQERWRIDNTIKKIIKLFNKLDCSSIPIKKPRFILYQKRILTRILISAELVNREFEIHSHGNSFRYFAGLFY